MIPEFNLLLIRDLRSSGILRSVDSYLPTFRDNLSVPSSRIKQSILELLDP
jgi:hypothetical protein